MLIDELLRDTRDFGTKYPEQVKQNLRKNISFRRESLVGLRAYEDLPDSHPIKKQALALDAKFGFEADLLKDILEVLVALETKKP